MARLRIRFVTKRTLTKTPTLQKKTETDEMRVSSPEATTLDLLRYVHACGSLYNVATVLSDLGERLNGKDLVKAAKADMEMASIQRLGFLLEHLGSVDAIASLADWVATQKQKNIPLKTNAPSAGMPRNKRWHVIVNEDVQIDA